MLPRHPVEIGNVRFEHGKYITMLICFQRKHIRYTTSSVSFTVFELFRASIDIFIMPQCTEVTRKKSNKISINHKKSNEMHENLRSLAALTFLATFTLKLQIRNSFMKLRTMKTKGCIKLGPWKSDIEIVP